MPKKKRKHTIVSTGIRKVPPWIKDVVPKFNVVDTKKMKRKKGKSGKPFKF